MSGGWLLWVLSSSSSSSLVSSWGVQAWKGVRERGDRISSELEGFTRMDFICARTYVQMDGLGCSARGTVALALSPFSSIQ